MARLVPAAAATIALFQSSFPALNAASTAALLNLPGSGRNRLRKFRVEASGVFVPAADSTLTLTIQAGSSNTPGTNQTIASSGAIACTATALAATYWGTLDLIFDSVSGKLAGTQSWMVNNTLVATSVITAQPTGLNDANEPVITFVHGASLSVPNAASYVQPDTFAIEA